MTGHNPMDRRKLGVKWQILTDKDGIPLYAVITSANTHMMLSLPLIHLIAWLPPKDLQNH